MKKLLIAAIGIPSLLCLLLIIVIVSGPSTVVPVANAELAPEAQALITKRLQDSKDYDAALGRLNDAIAAQTQAQKDMNSASTAAHSRETLLCTDYKLRWDTLNKVAIPDANCPLQ